MQTPVLCPSVPSGATSSRDKGLASDIISSGPYHVEASLPIPFPLSSARSDCWVYAITPNSRYIFPCSPLSTKDRRRASPLKMSGSEDKNLSAWIEKLKGRLTGYFADSNKFALDRYLGEGVHAHAWLVRHRKQDKDPWSKMVLKTPTFAANDIYNEALIHGPESVEDFREEAKLLKVSKPQPSPRCLKNANGDFLDHTGQASGQTHRFRPPRGPSRHPRRSPKLLWQLDLSRTPRARDSVGICEEVRCPRHSVCSE